MAIALAFALPSAAHATYFASCDLRGIVASSGVVAQTLGDTATGPSFTFRVTRARAAKSGARNDADCKIYRRKVLEIVLPVGTPAPTPGDRLWLNMSIIETEDAPRSVFFGLLP